MFAALFSHMALLLKGKHNLVGLPTTFGTAFMVLAIPAVILDSILNIGIELLPVWVIFLELLIPVAMVMLLGYAIASAMLIVLIFFNSIWILAAALAMQFEIQLPIFIYLAAIAYNVFINVMYWEKNGLRR